MKIIELLFESPQEIYKNYFSDIPQDAFLAIASADPHPKKIVRDGDLKRLGGFTKRLLQLYRKGDFTLDDLPYLTKALMVYKGDISKLKTINELEGAENNSGVKIIWHDADWQVEQVPDYETSCEIYNRDTSWCTASTELEGEGSWDTYTAPGNELYAIRNKHNVKELYILAINNKKLKEFKNKKNRGETTDLYPWLRDKPGLKKFIESRGVHIPDKFLEIDGQFIGYEKQGNVYEFFDIILSGGNTKHLPQELQDLGEYNVKGNFTCRDSSLVDLRGAPQYVGGNFNVDTNDLVSLKGGPKVVMGMFSCAYNKLTSLEHSPKYVGKSFICYDNDLESTDGLNTVKGHVTTKNPHKRS